jgi:hypothetical protein
MLKVNSLGDAVFWWKNILGISLLVHFSVPCHDSQQYCEVLWADICDAVPDHKEQANMKES